MNDVRITIIIPVFNMRETIGRAIESVLSQDYENKELLVLDGGSIDGTLEIIKDYQENIDYFISQQDGGPSDAIASNLSHATGEFVGVLGADDWYAAGALSAAAKTIVESSADVIYGDCNEIYPNGEILYKNASGINLDNLYYLCVFNTNAAFLKRELLANYYESYLNKSKERITLATDHYLWLLLYHSGKKFAYITSQSVITNFSMSGRSNIGSYQLCIEDSKVFGLVTRNEKELYEKRKSICEKYCATRLVRLYEQVIGKKRFQHVLEQYMDYSRRYIIFGMGHMGQSAFHVLSLIGAQPEYFVDNHPSVNSRHFLGIGVFKPDRLYEEVNATIILATVGYEDEMMLQIENMDLDKSMNIQRFTDICLNVKNNLGIEILEDAYKKGVIR